jgi:hypothetical protein
VRSSLSRMAEESGTERTDDLDELRARIEAIETGKQRAGPASNHDERAAASTGLRRSSSLRRSAMQRKTPLRRTRKAK